MKRKNQGKRIATDLPPLPDGADPSLEGIEPADKKEETKEVRSEDLYASSSLENDQLRAIASLLFSNLGGIASVEAENESTLVITLDDQVWKLMVEKGRVTLQGFPETPNLDQYIGKLKEGSLKSILIISDKCSKMIKKHSGEKEEPPPIKFQGESSEIDDNDLEQGANELIDSGNLSEDQPEELPQEGMGPPVDLPPELTQSNSQQPGLPTPPPVGNPQGDVNSIPGGLPTYPVQPNYNIPQFPQSPPVTSSIKKIKSSLDDLANEIQSLGMVKLARRLDLVTNSLEILEE
jgi:hypothetical protein